MNRFYYSLPTHYKLTTNLLPACYKLATKILQSLQSLQSLQALWPSTRSSTKSLLWTGFTTKLLQTSTNLYSSTRDWLRNPEFADEGKTLSYERENGSTRLREQRGSKERGTRGRKEGQDGGWKENCTWGWTPEGVWWYASDVQKEYRPSRRYTVTANS